MRNRNEDGPNVEWQHGTKPAKSERNGHNDTIKYVQGVFFPQIFTLQYKPSVLDEGGGELHAQTAKKEVMAGGMADPERPSDDGDTVV
jgi:DUF2075 family protein